ncbi:MAG: hypothetical protein JRI72_05135 [Deltaproteobacteria bacterium]|nr:hypothetical protein [Deltaproteobacteria bacterium]
MAERVFRRRLKEHNRNDIEVSSAALYDMGRAPADPRSVELLNKKGFDGYGHKSRPLTEDMIAEADKVIAMEGAHQEVIIDKYPDAEGKVYLLKSFSENYNGLDEDIKDPSGRSDYHYRLCFAEIYMAVEGLTKRCI